MCYIFVDSQTMNVIGVISIVFFYCLILMVGLWAGKKKHTGNSEEEVMLAGRNIGLFVGIFTMTGKITNLLTKIIIILLNL